MSGAQQITGAVNAYIGGEAADQASRQIQGGARRGLQTWRDIYQGNVGDLNKFVEPGTEAYQRLADLAGPSGELGRKFTVADFLEDPSYKFAMEQGLKAIGASNAGRGGALGGGALKGLERFATGLAGEQFQRSRDYFTGNQLQNYNQLMGLGQMGLNALGTRAQLGQQFGAGAMEQETGIGQAQAAGTLGRARAYQQGITQMGQGASATTPTGIGSTPNQYSSLLGAFGMGS